MAFVHATTRSGSPASIDLEQFPDQCPLCHNAVNPSFLSAVAPAIDSPDWTEAAFQCPRIACQRIFVATYRVAVTHGRCLGTLTGVAPLAARAVPLPPEIEALSPFFANIYQQSLHAETQGLDQLVGIGLRKALEFLVKDFALHSNPAEREKILSAYLAPCIAAYVDDARVKECATLATWLGNDETHYERRWTDKDISDLKRLLRLTINWVENVLVTENYVRDMNPPKSTTAT